MDNWLNLLAKLANQVIFVTVCVADYLHPPMGSTLIYWSRRHTHSIRTKTISIMHNALERIGRIRSFILY